MECNKDEAIRAKEIAEKKFMGKDYTGAKKFVLKAQSLYPELEGLSQMLSVLNVYISAENRISSGEVDWYCVLDVNCYADDNTVKKQYHKLALMLHPDKNKSLGADGAFKLVQEAWVLLSDKEKRLAYNQKLNPMGWQQKVSTRSKVPSAQHSANGFHKTQKPDKFWAICNQCMICFACPRVYLNRNVLCPNCRQSFLAVEKDSPCQVKRPNGDAAGSVVHQAHDVLKRADELLARAHDQLKQASDQLKHSADQLKHDCDQLKHKLEQVNQQSKGWRF